MSDSVITEQNEAGVVVGYRCDLLTQGNAFDPVAMPYYYDLSSPCEESVNARQMVESLLLDSVATAYRMLPDAVSCSAPPRTNSGEPWLASVRAEEPAEFVTDIFACEQAPPLNSGACCNTVKGVLSLSTVGGYNVDVVRDHIKTALNDGWLTSGTDFATSYRGSKVEFTPESGRGTIPVINGVKAPAMQAPRGRGVSLFGSMIIAAVVGVVSAALFTAYRRRKQAQRRRNQAPGVALHKSLDDDFGDGQSFDLPTIAIDVVSEASHRSKELHSFNSSQPASYRFDLSDAMRDDVMGKFGGGDAPPSWGPTSIAVVPPYPLEETSDSEVDSWAQTDGTVGSLETRLEVIEAEI